MDGCFLPVDLSDGQFTLRNTAPRPAELTFVVVNRMTMGADPRLLGSFAGDVGSVRHTMSRERRAFLLTGDLSSGFGVGSALHLPLVPPTAFEIVVPVTDSTRWTSFRIYDSGVCSGVERWPNFAAGLAAAVDAALGANPVPNHRMRRISDAAVLPLLRGWPNRAAIDRPTDSILYEARYQACSIQGCSPFTIDLSIGFGFRPVLGTLRDAEGCGGEAGEPPVPGTLDFLGVVDFVRVEIVDFCNFEGDIEDKVRSDLEAALPAAIRDAVRDALVVDPILELGFPRAIVRPCTCHDDCDVRSAGGPAWVGTRHPCVNRRCQLQLEPKRLNLRPDAFEAVVIEDEADPQRTLLSLAPFPAAFTQLCADDREAPPDDMVPPEPMELQTAVIHVPPRVFEEPLCQ